MKSDHIFISKDSLFRGVIHTKNITVEGVVTGEVHAADKVLIKKGAFVDGPIRTKKILFEEGARHNGMMKLWEQNGQAIEKARPSILPQQEPEKEKEQVRPKEKPHESEKQTGKLW